MDANIYYMVGPLKLRFTDYESAKSYAIGTSKRRGKLIAILEIQDGTIIDVTYPKSK